jgi:hypothetical protein
MNLNNFINELRSMGFSEEVISEIKESLADLYVASWILYGFVRKHPFRIYTFEDIERTKYWTYSEMAEKILYQYGFIVTGSEYTIYSEDINWFSLALSKKGLPIAKEAFIYRLQNNLSFINELIEKYKHILPILSYGASYDTPLNRYYFWYNYKTNIISLHDYNVIKAKIGWMPEPPREKRTIHTAQELWKKIKEIYVGEKLDIVSLAFQSVASTKVVTDIINEFFTQLHGKRLVLLEPHFNSRRVSDEERWLLTEELLNIFKERMKEEMTGNRLEKIKAIIKDYITILLIYLGGQGLTKGQISSIIKVIVNENKDLNLSHYELEGKFYKMINEISSLTNCISKFNEAGGPESKPFIVFNYNDLDKVIKNYIEELGSKTISYFIS